jgi:hypothetical protein
MNDLKQLKLFGKEFVKDGLRRLKSLLRSLLLNKLKGSYV